MSSNEMDRRRLLAGAAGAASLAAFDKANAQDGKVSPLGRRLIIA